MRRTRGRWMMGVLAILACIVLAPTNARAGILGLDSGTYDVALTCPFAGCGGPFTGTLTTDGIDVTSWLFDTNFDGFPLSFSGNPTEFVIGLPTDFEQVFGPNTGFGYALNLFGGFVAGNWSIDSGGVELWHGTWKATPQDEETVPEPATLLLFGTGAGSLLARARRRRSTAPAGRAGSAPWR